MPSLERPSNLREVRTTSGASRGDVDAVRLIGSLTALRFFAALAIVVHHSIGILLPAGYMTGTPLDAGVSFFFVLSGFILTYVHQDGMQGMSRIRFYQARFARIWPATMFSLIVLVLLLPHTMYLPFLVINWTGGLALTVIASFVLLIQSWIPIPAYYFSFNAVAWSVSDEMFFYLVFPFLLLSLSRTWYWKLLLIMGLGLAMVLMSDAVHLPAYSMDDLGSVTAHGISYINPIVRLKEFAIGMSVALLFIRVRSRVVFGFVSFTVVEILLVLALPRVVRGEAGLRGRVAARIAPNLSSSVNMFLDQTVIAVFFAVFVLVFACNAGALSRVLSTRFFVVLGEISFSIYLLHQIFLDYYQAHFQNAGWLPDHHRFAVYLVVTCLAAYATWRWIETPSRRRLRSAFGREDEARSTAQ
jgi:peptidoglycan/LPS O-acetylase OafA/YrhL